MEESWFKVTRADPVIEDRFNRLWIQSGGPADASLYGKRVAKATELYFNPAAAALAPDLLREYGAVPCPPPDLTQRPGKRPRVALLVGRQPNT